VNGEQENISADEKGYYNIKRRWRKGDKVAIEFSMSVYAVTMPDNKNRQAFFYGPVLLAGDLGTKEPDPVKGIPVVVSDVTDPSKWIARDANQFQFASLKVGQPQDISFRPFNQVKDQYYSVYFDLFSSDGWKEQQVKYEAEKSRLQEIERLTVDVLRMGEMQPERDHEFTGDTYTGEGHGKKWRATRQAGSMSFILKVDASKENEIQLTYWGMDNRGRVFDILVDGKPFATEDLNKYKGSQFYDIRYPVPVSLTQGKEKVTITLKAAAANSVGPVYGNVRMMTK
jgi:hypothetical protein